MTLTDAARDSLRKIQCNFLRVKILCGRNVHSANRLYEVCKDFWKWQSELSKLIPIENYDVRHVDNIDKWLFILSQTNDEITDDEFMEMKRNFIEASAALSEIISRPTRQE